jgi:rhodanese-related sulfurtransferase
MRRRETIEEMLESARGELDRMAPDQAREAMERGGLLVDIRSERQRERDGVVPGAAYFPRNVLEWRADPSSSAHDPRFSDLDRPVVVMCDEGYQSSLAAATLQRLGFEGATDLIGGYQAWRAAGLPTGSCRD